MSKARLRAMIESLELSNEALRESLRLASNAWRAEGVRHLATMTERDELKVQLDLAADACRKLAKANAAAIERIVELST